MSSIVFISIGSNLPDGAMYIERAFDYLNKCYKNVICSKIYSTPSVTVGDDSVYFNAVVRCTINDINSLDYELKLYETQCGRIRGNKNVVIDLDVVLADGRILRKRDFDSKYFQIGYNQIKLLKFKRPC